MNDLGPRGGQRLESRCRCRWRNSDDGTVDRHCGWGPDRGDPGAEGRQVWLHVKKREEEAREEADEGGDDDFGSHGGGGLTDDEDLKIEKEVCVLCVCLLRLVRSPKSKEQRG